MVPDCLRCQDGLPGAGHAVEHHPAGLLQEAAEPLAELLHQQGPLDEDHGPLGDAPLPQDHLDWGSRKENITLPCSDPVWIRPSLYPVKTRSGSDLL